MTNTEQRLEELFAEIGPRTSGEYIMGEIHDLVGGDLFPRVLLDRYKREKTKLYLRSALLWFAVPFGRTSQDAVDLGLLAIYDRSSEVRYRACAVLAYSLRNDVIPHLELAKTKTKHKGTLEDIDAALDAINNQNHNLYLDRLHTGRAFWHVGDEPISANCGNEQSQQTIAGANNRSIGPDRIMDKQKRDALVGRMGSDGAPIPLVTLEEFFEGNDDAGSIWCNLESNPQPSQVYELLKVIRARPEVHDIRIAVTQYDGGEDEWPFSDTIVFVTSATPKAVRQWLGKKFAPDEISVESHLPFTEELDVPAGAQTVWAWWD